MHIQNWINFLSIHSQDNQQKNNSDINQGPLILDRVIANGVYLDFINTDAYTKFDKNPSINSQDIEHEQNSDVNQGP